MVKVERVQTGTRIVKRLVKALKGLVEHLDILLGGLVEGITLYVFKNKTAFNLRTRKRINN